MESLESRKEFLAFLKSIRSIKNQYEIISKLSLSKEEKAVIEKATKELQLTLKQHFK